MANNSYPYVIAVLFFDGTRTDVGYKGRATAAGLREYVAALDASMLPGGANAHLATQVATATMRRGSFAGPVVAAYVEPSVLLSRAGGAHPMAVAS